MIRKFVDRFMQHKADLEKTIGEKPPENYKDLVQAVVALITSDEYEDIDPERVHEINDGDYQGTLLYVIAAKGYQPRRYWYVKVDYGSCSGCDTLKSIRGYSDDKPNELEITQYMTLALHIVQGLKQMSDEDEE